MKRALVNVSPLILAAACTLLAVIIGSFAVNNYRREKVLMTGALQQRTLSIIRAVDYGMRGSMRGHMTGAAAGVRYDWVNHIQEIISQVMEEEDIHFITLVDSNGTILASSDTSLIGSNLAPPSVAFALAAKRGAPVFRFTGENEGQGEGYQAAEAFGAGMPRNMPHFNMRARGMKGRLGQEDAPVSRLQEEAARTQAEKYSLLVEIDTEAFDSAVRRQMLQIVILSIVLLLVGVGGWLSLLTLQGLKGSQTRLRQIRAFNDILIESLPVGILATGADGTIQIMNGAAETIAGLPAARALAGKPAGVLPYWLADMFGGKRQRQPLVEELTVEKPEGGQRTLFITRVSIAEEGDDSIGEVLLLQDVSEVRGLENRLRRSERLAALGKMAAGVAHELRNPLSSIKGLAVLLKGKMQEDTQGIQTADIMVQEVERLNRSISELLDYARHEKLSKTAVSLRKLVEKTLSLVRVDAEQQGIVVSTSFTDHPDSVLVDEDRMNQVLLNILLNGIQAIGGAGHIEVATAVADGKVVCEVKDSGAGIDRDILTKVFDPYFTTKNDGTGLGLAISAKIVEEHGGEITIESEVGKGTTVRVVLAAV